MSSVKKIEVEISPAVLGERLNSYHDKHTRRVNNVDFAVVVDGAASKRYAVIPRDSNGANAMLKAPVLRQLGSIVHDVGELTACGIASGEQRYEQLVAARQTLLDVTRNYTAFLSRSEVDARGIAHQGELSWYNPACCARISA
jgi:hypothetical protein